MDVLFDWLEKTSHRFATADEVLADPAYSTRHDYVAEDGVSLWERIKAERRQSEVPAALKTALDAQVAAWNRGDLDAFVALYAVDATFISPSGIAHGRQEVLERYRRKYPDRTAMARSRSISPKPASSPARNSPSSRHRGRSRAGGHRRRPLDARL